MYTLHYMKYYNKHFNFFVRGYFYPTEHLPPVSTVTVFFCIAFLMYYLLRDFPWWNNHFMSVDH